MFLNDIPERYKYLTDKKELSQSYIDFKKKQSKEWYNRFIEEWELNHYRKETYKELKKIITDNVEKIIDEINK